MAQETCQDPTVIGAQPLAMVKNYSGLINPGSSQFQGHPHIQTSTNIMWLSERETNKNTSSAKRIQTHIHTRHIYIIYIYVERDDIVRDVHVEMKL